MQDAGMKGRDPERAMRAALVVTLLFFGVEVAGGLLSGSLSLLGDAGHMLGDVFSLVLSLSALRLARKLPSIEKTFGYHRTEILAAFINGLLLIAASAVIAWQAFRRISAPPAVDSTAMLAVALAGLLANLYAALRLHGGRDLNVRSAFLHVLTDMLSSAAVLLAAVAIKLTKLTIIDPLLAAAIALFVSISGIGIVRNTVRILLEFTPRSVRFDDILHDILSVDGVRGVHNVHLWSLCSNVNILDAHIFSSERDAARLESIKGEIKARLEKFDIKHSTLEFECEECRDPSQVRPVVH